MLERLLREATRRGLRRGIGEGSRVWLLVGAAAVGLRLLRWMAGPGKPIVVTEELAPGETLEIRHLPR